MEELKITQKTYFAAPTEMGHFVATSDSFKTIDPNKVFAFLCPICGDFIEIGVPPLNESKRESPLCHKCTELVRKLALVGKTRSDLADEFKAECEKRNIELVAEPYHLGGILRKLAEWKECTNEIF